MKMALTTNTGINLVELFSIHSVYSFSLHCAMLQFVTMMSLNEDTCTYIGLPYFCHNNYS